MPVLAKAPAGFENPKEWWTPQNIGSACRIGAEMGVDFIKTTFSGDLESFKSIISQLYVPVVVLGGGKIGDPKDLLNNIYASMQAGANGVAWPQHLPIQRPRKNHRSNSCYRSRWRNSR
jgi:DhnA family fructose-bisphosphate aldolase class Ia